MRGRYWFVSLSAIDFFVRSAEWADSRFDFFNEPVGEAFLFSACAAAEEAFEAPFCHFTLLFGNGFSGHNLLLYVREFSFEFI